MKCYQQPTAHPVALSVDKVMARLLARLGWRVPGLDESVLFHVLMVHHGTSMH